MAPELMQSISYLKTTQLFCFCYINDCFEEQKMIQKRFVMTIISQKDVA